MQSAGAANSARVKDWQRPRSRPASSHYVPILGGDGARDGDRSREPQGAGGLDVPAQGHGALGHRAVVSCVPPRAVLRRDAGQDRAGRLVARPAEA
eukprot:7346014-Pyramimonas_sp.AAC.1